MLLLWPADVPVLMEQAGLVLREWTERLAYAVGAAHAGRGLAQRAVRVALRRAVSGGATGARLHIAGDNAASQRVAAATGLARQDDQPLVVRRRKGQVLHLAV